MAKIFVNYYDIKTEHLNQNKKINISYSAFKITFDEVVEIYDCSIKG